VNLLVEVLAWLAAGYIAVVAIMYVAQTRLIFPTYLASFATGRLPSSAERISVTASDGTRLAGVVFSPGAERNRDDLLLLGFGGNVWNVENMALSLHRQFPSMYVAGFHYRGYSPSEGRAGAKQLLTDSLELFDHLQSRLPGIRTVVVGFSLGSAVAACVARNRPVAGVVLVTPFDSLVELARDQFPWLPVRMLIRHRMPTIEFMLEVSAPTALISAGRDSVVPDRRTEPLRRAVPNLVLDRTVPEAEHNDLYERDEFWAALGDAVARICTYSPERSLPETQPPPPVH
jgi:pimeloyl-ACP methyl ester carboxylesterase